MISFFFRIKLFVMFIMNQNRIKRIPCSLHSIDRKVMMERDNSLAVVSVGQERLSRADRRNMVE